jgi:hypothetical protein
LRDNFAFISFHKKKEQIANKVILKEYTNRLIFQSMRLTGNQSLLESHQHTEQKGVIDSLKSLFSGATGGK